MIRSRRGSMTRDGAERIALAALADLVADPGRLGGFLAATGIGPDTLRAAAATPGFLIAVLDHLMANGETLELWCAGAGLAPETVAIARTHLAEAAD